MVSYINYGLQVLALPSTSSLNELERVALR